MKKCSPKKAKQCWEVCAWQRNRNLLPEEKTFIVNFKAWVETGMHQTRRFYKKDKKVLENNLYQSLSKNECRTFKSLNVYDYKIVVPADMSSLVLHTNYADFWGKFNKNLSDSSTCVLLSKWTPIHPIQDVENFGISNKSNGVS